MIFLPSFLAYLTVTLLIFGFVQSTNKVHPIEEFTFHQIIEPNFYNSQGAHLSSDSLKILPCSEFARLQFLLHNVTLSLDLKENHNLIPDNYFEQIHLNGSLVTHQKHQLKPSNHCHFQGSLSSDPDSFAALSIFRGTLSGIIYSTNESYHIHYDDSASKTLLFMSSHYKNIKNFKCGVEDASTDQSKQSFHSFRPKRSTDRKEPYRNNAKTRYVELVLVNDNKEYIECGRDRETVIEKNKQIANIVNALYNQLNIFVALVGVIIWSDHDEITLSTNGDTTLNNFLRYRKERLVPKHPNDNAQLITGTTFDAGVVGKALKGPICTYEFSGGVNTDHSHLISLVATTVAHELGHNFGMEHDTPECVCKDAEKCIMSHSSGAYSPRKWSSCSVKYLDDAFSRGMDFCLKNQPRMIIGPVCGNGFTEEGEECDCGLKDFCDNPCCDPSTCKLKTGAKCAIGICCDLSTCSVVKASSHQTCRPASGECDFPEYCDGSSELCPEDRYVQDGTECGSEEAFCLNGTCSSYNSQCKLLWGDSGAVSSTACYDQNRFGKPSGNCGFNRINKTYIPCSVSDTLCGMLHCTHTNERLEFGMYSAAILHKTFITQKEGDSKSVLACHSAVIDLGLETVDPGLVPNGAKCGENKMCLNQRCTPVEKIRGRISCPNDCSGNGLCDNKGMCHCMDGFAEPDCEQPLPRWYHLTLAMYIIFLCILPLTAFAAFIAYYFHSNIKTWWILRTRKANIKSRAKQSSISKVQHLTPHMDLKSLKISGPLSADQVEQKLVTSTTGLTTTTPAPSTTATTVLTTIGNGNSVPWATVVSPPVQVVKPLRSTNHVGPVSYPKPPRPTAPPLSAVAPARPAPPPPPLPSQRSSPSSKTASGRPNQPAPNRLTAGNLSRSTSLRSSTRTHLERPKHPPPKPPPIDQNEDNSSSDSSSDPPPSSNNSKDLQRPLMNNREEDDRKASSNDSIGQASFAARLAALQASFNASNKSSSHPPSSLSNQSQIKSKVGLVKDSDEQSTGNDKHLR